MWGVCSRQQQRRLSTEQLRDISLSPCMSAHTYLVIPHWRLQSILLNNRRTMVTKN